MKILGFEFGGNDKKQEAPPKGKVTNQAFSTPFFTIRDGNLSAPYVNRYYTLQNIVQFGADNLYPQVLNQLYFQSPMTGACVDFITNAVIGGGWEWKDPNVSGEQKIEQEAFKRKNKLNKLSKILTRDYVIHRRVCVVVHKKGGKLVRLERLDPSTIRHNYSVDKFIYSTDWSRGMLENIEYPRYYKGCPFEKSLYLYQDNSPGQDTYAIPAYNSVLNWAYLDADYSFFHKSNLQNGIFPSVAIRRPKEFSSIDEIDAFKREIGNKTGPANGGRVLVLTGNGFDDTPEIVQINPNSNDKAFEWTSKELKENIAIGFKINPAIMGIKVSGQLGASTEIQDSYTIFEKNVVMCERDTMDEILNDLIDIAGIKNTIVINDYQIIGGAITDTTETA
jgi:hypothetical protein